MIRLPLCKTLVITSSVLLSACGSSTSLENTEPTTAAALSAENVPTEVFGPEATQVIETSEVVSEPDESEETSDVIEVQVPTANEVSAIELEEEAVVSLPVSCGANDESMRLRMLDLINSARAQARSCGTKAYDATGPLSWNTQLLNAAKIHSNDMAEHNFFSHTGSDGSSVADRASAAGYQWRRIGENIAAGQTSAEQTVNGWLESPGHCENLMEPDFTEVSVACTSDSGSDFSRYWTNVLGTSFQ